MSSPPCKWVRKRSVWYFKNDITTKTFGRVYALFRKDRDAIHWYWEVVADEYVYHQNCNCICGWTKSLEAGKAIIETILYATGTVERY